MKRIRVEKTRIIVRDQNFTQRTSAWAFTPFQMLRNVITASLLHVSAREGTEKRCWLSRQGAWAECQNADRSSFFFFLFFFWVVRLIVESTGGLGKVAGKQCEVRTLAAENRWFMVSALSYTPPRECSPIHPLFGARTAWSKTANPDKARTFDGHGEVGSDKVASEASRENFGFFSTIIHYCIFNERRKWPSQAFPENQVHYVPDYRYI
jgi:hypothetical protein